ncbi:ParB/RepB/Spo0J family partition protein [Lutimaribacter marinistellae]|uniref:ParB/RepB/Spo0J family partition protein n=1 Tax=Lutimaribacter marinistellae TaxID=1820329 RepID=A0ABV7TC26_9RHOB
MSRKRRVFDIEVPGVDDMEVGKVPDRALARRGPMASAISENAGALKARREAEQAIRAENDRLAKEFVQLKREGLVTGRIPLEEVVTEKLVRDRKPGLDDALDELKTSIREIGLSNPIRVEARSDGRYELIQGMRRLLAYRALLDETGEEIYRTIPAGITPLSDDTATTYRRMVDENLIRKDISFAEMAELARRYAQDPANDCADAGEAVAILFKSASYTKRSYIRAFADLLARFDKLLEHPADIPRNLGVDLKRRLDREPELVSDIVHALRAAPGRDAAQEIAILRGFVTDSGAGTLPTGNTGASPARPRKARTTFQVSTDEGVAKCTASQGKLELRTEQDFSAIDRVKLERAIAAFFRELEE